MTGFYSRQDATGLRRSSIPRPEQRHSVYFCPIMAGLVDTNAFSTISASILSDETASQAGDLYIRSITFSPDCKYLATGAEDRQIRVSTAWFRHEYLATQANLHGLFVDMGHQDEAYSSPAAGSSTRNLLARILSGRRVHRFWFG
jgi:hypothetical protein